MFKGAVIAPRDNAAMAVVENSNLFSLEILMTSPFRIPSFRKAKASFMLFS